ncbi:unknown transmembrane protein [Mesoplasma florum L1]|uniref:Uncharacterized protein n=1 Tax=Mesoplasma florum (strain ATCC 33453 / NBRC 100688 / NCTC 11704 / L1) TaxID=265311 RepID=Q6F1Q5_MESFL|nr:hypothetical protein [Mesoplasma florum]AAT75568.1 unknown transmembrane protein [Mesoplasma florum L1]ATI73166.1 hypothetical protein CQZ69_01135 [Mesoplasma florum]AVN61568.1 hypothetical protein CG004_01135 [Mesoplasma florum]
MNRQQTIGLIILLIGLAFFIGFGLIALFYRKTIKKSDDFLTEKKYVGMREFTKTNFTLFLSLFGLVLAIAGLVFLI